MAPSKKQKVNKNPKANKLERKEDNLENSVVSGQLQKKINKKQHIIPKDLKGVVFIKNLPHGFFEEQLKKYFEQFGNVTRVRLARSRRTGNSKGYAFVEFEYPEVAEVAAETMNNYLMFKQIVKASYIPPEKQQFNYFRSSVKQVKNKTGKLIWVSGKTASIQRKVNKFNDWSDENFEKRTEKQLKKLQKIGEKYSHLGIDINELVVHPKKSVEKEKLKATALENKKSLAGDKKKSASDDVPSKKENAKTSKNKVFLKDLLESTIQDDSEDEDYIATNESEEEDEESLNSSDEETYGFGEDSNGEDHIEKDSEEEDAKQIMQKKSKISKNKSKASNVERVNEILKRKPHTGGINKIIKKPSKQTSVGNKEKSALKLAAAKELAKPLTKVKGKISRPLKSKKGLKKQK